jgi:NSS family neurotransmitter:Na+ symporter
MIIPAVFAFSHGDEAALAQKGAGLMFETLPRVFDTMFGGTVIGVLFFFMVLLAALTSSISLMETIVSIFMDKFKLGRKVSCLIVLGISVLIGVPASLGYGVWSAAAPLGMAFLDFFDFVSNSLMMPIVALITCIFVAYILKPKTTIADEIELSGKFKWRKLYEVVIKYVAPVCILAILVSSVLDVFGVIKI